MTLTTTAAGRRVFGEMLQQIRHQRGLTQAQVATAAGILVAHLSELELGKRQCGPQVAGQLVAALRVPEIELERFLLAAAKTTQRGKVYTAEEWRERLGQQLSRALLRNGIKAGSVVSARGHRSTGPDFTIRTREGTTYTIELKVRRE